MTLKSLMRRGTKPGKDCYPAEVAPHQMVDDDSFTEDDGTAARPLPRSSFLQLAKLHRFGEITMLLEKPDDYDLDSWLNLSSSSGNRKNGVSGLLRRQRGMDELTAFHQFKGETPLHMIVYYRPSEYVVDRLIAFLTERSETVPEDVVDMMGRNPLHVGAAKACPALTMARLVNGVSGVMPAVAKDYMGRHPLHWACTNPNGLVEKETVKGNYGISSWCLSPRLLCSSQRAETDDADMDMSAVDNMVQVVFLLLKAYPEAVAITDMNGETPLDLARANKADKRILKLLYEAGQCFVQVYSPFKNPSERFRKSSGEEEVPIEVTESSDIDDGDDVSSIGSSGVSLYNKRRKSKRKSPSAPWALRVMKIEEKVEL